MVKNQRIHFLSKGWGYHMYSDWDGWFFCLFLFVCLFFWHVLLSCSLNSGEYLILKCYLKGEADNRKSAVGAGDLWIYGGEVKSWAWDTLSSGGAGETGRHDSNMWCAELWSHLIEIREREMTGGQGRMKRTERRWESTVSRGYSKLCPEQGRA